VTSCMVKDSNGGKGERPVASPKTDVLRWSGHHALKPVSKCRPSLLCCRFVLSEFLLQQGCCLIRAGVHVWAQWGVAVGRFENRNGNFHADSLDEFVREDHVRKRHPEMLRESAVFAMIASAIAHNPLVWILVRLWRANWDTAEPSDGHSLRGYLVAMLICSKPCDRNASLPQCH